MKDTYYARENGAVYVNSEQHKTLSEVSEVSTGEFTSPRRAPEDEPVNTFTSFSHVHVDRQCLATCPICTQPAVLEARPVPPHGSPDVPRDCWPVVTCCRGCHEWWLVVREADDEVMALATGVLTEREAKRQAAQALVYHEREGSL